MMLTKSAFMVGIALAMMFVQGGAAADRIKKKRYIIDYLLSDPDQSPAPPHSLPEPNAAQGLAEDHEPLAVFPPRGNVPIPRAKPIRALLSPHPIRREPARILTTRDGGKLIVYAFEASRMLSSGERYRVRGDQYSAAAMQVLFIENRAPDRICAERSAWLHFHLPYNPRTRKMEKEAFFAFVGPESGARLGKIPHYGKGWKIVKALDYLGECESE